MPRGRTAGMRGSVRQHRSGRWQARLPKSLDPSMRPLETTFPTREDAVVALRKRIKEVESGEIVITDPHQLAPDMEVKVPARTVSDVMEDFLREHVDLAVNTVKGYRSLIRHVICHETLGIGHVEVASLTGSSVTVWRRGLVAQGVTASNADAAFRALRSALSWDVESGRLERNPALGLTTRRTKARTASRSADAVRLPTWAEVHQIATAIPDRTQRIMLLLLAFCGMRISELCAVEPGALLHATREIQLQHVWVKPTGEPWRREPLKGGLSRRVPVPLGLWEHLAEHAQAWTPPPASNVPTLFRPPNANRNGVGFWTATLWRDLTMLPAIAKSGRDYRTKDLRAYAASALVDIGATQAEAQLLLGHASADTTQKHYIRAHLASAHDPARMELRIDPSLTTHQRLDALWDAFVERFDDPLV